MPTLFARNYFAPVALAALALSCGGNEADNGAVAPGVSASDTTPVPTTNPNAPCDDPAGMWTYDNCSMKEGICRKKDGTVYRTNCQLPATEMPISGAPPLPPAPTTTGTVPGMPTGTVTGMPTVPVPGMPTGTVTTMPTVPVPGMPTGTVTGMPTGTVTGMPTVVPTDMPTAMPTDTTMPTTMPTDMPPTGDAPAGYWQQGTWGGCSWTGVDDLGVGTNISPTDFLTGTTDGAYCVSGVVEPAVKWESVALLGFNLAQDAATADCTYKEVDPSSEGPPGVELTGSGIALNFAKRGADTSFTLRVQIQGPNGHKEGEVGSNDRWCSTIAEVQGTAFIPWSDFNTQCWEGGEGSDYSGEPISAIVFSVPGGGWPEDMPDQESSAEPVNFDFCINGFAGGESAADAPTGGVSGGDQMGTVGEGSTADRAKVNVDGENYIVQNNAWGSGAGLVLDYVNNSFTVTSATGSGASAPASFPSIYVGANGFTNEGAYDTKTTDNLPVLVSNIASANTTFRWSGNNGSFNATYDVWFANSDPQGKRYNDGLNGFVMVWLAKPSGGQVPIGSDQGDVMIAGQNWDVWVGPRGTGPSATEGAELQSSGDAPVVSYVAKTTLNSLTFNLKDFIDDAASHGIRGDMYLTDVFAGFEIWNGGNGLKVDEFKIDVQKSN